MDNKPRLAIFFFEICCSAFLLNLFWEVSHSMLYNWNLLPLINDIYFYVLRILYASLADAFMILVILLINCMFRKGFSWISSPKKRDYLVFGILGLLFAIFVEIRAMLLGLWGYNEYMPLVFGIGLTPFVQLAATGMLSLLITSMLIRKNKG